MPAKVVEENRAKGEYFSCNEKYSPTHNCKFKYLYILEIHGDEEGEGNNSQLDDEGGETEAQPDKYTSSLILDLLTTLLVQS